MAAFSQDDVGKRVVAQSGATVGEVAEVRGGTAWVELAPDPDDDAVSQLRWEGTVNQNRHELEDRFVTRVTEDAVRLRV